jgi:inorganic pyrophosphatase
MSLNFDFEKLPLQPLDHSNTSTDFLVYAIVEQEYGTQERTVWDEAKHEFIKTGLVMSVPLPAPYGWIPQTLSEGDKDALDVLIMTERSLVQGDYLVVCPIGVLLRRDQDHKVLAVDLLDPEFKQWRDYTDLPENWLHRIEDWFRPYFELDGWLDALGAQQMIEQAHTLFEQAKT